MTDKFYKTHKSSFFFGKRGKITGDIFIDDKLVFREDELVTILGKAEYSTQYGLRQGLEIESKNGNNEIISHNKVELYENINDLCISESEYLESLRSILDNFRVENNVKNYGQLAELIFKYHILIKDLEQLIIITPQTTLSELNLNIKVKTLLIQMGYGGNKTLDDISKIETSKFKRYKFGETYRQELENYLKLAGLSFK